MKYALAGFDWRIPPKGTTKFHVSDVLTVTTGRLVSSRHMEGVYDVLNFLTGDNLSRHQLDRAMHECEPWLRLQFPALMSDSPRMAEFITQLEVSLEPVAWVEQVRSEFGLPEQIPLYELGADMGSVLQVRCQDF